MNGVNMAWKADVQGPGIQWLHTFCFHFIFLLSTFPSTFNHSEGKRKELMSCLVAMGTSCLTEKEWRVSGPTVAYWPLTHVSKNALTLKFQGEIFAYLKYKIYSSSHVECPLSYKWEQSSVAADQSHLLQVVRAVVPNLCGTRDWFHGR